MISEGRTLRALTALGPAGAALWGVAVVCMAMGSAGRARADERVERLLAAALTEQSIDGERVRAWPASPQLDAAREIVGAELAWARGGGGRGAGATVCVVDTGVDLRHRDFRDATGRTRARWLYDLHGSPRGVHGALERGRGAVWSREEIDAALAAGTTPAPDRSGHGTAVASAALGDDAPSSLGLDGLRAGVAPEAELVVVRALDEALGGFRDQDVVRGAQFCVDPRVGEASRTVVLLALGGHDGPHDGTSAYERAIAAVVSAGAAVVVAAGNDAGRSVHASVRVTRDAPLRMTLLLPPAETDDGLVAIAVRGAREVRASLPRRDLGAWASQGTVRDDGTLRVDASDDAVTYVIARGALPSGELTIEVRGARGAAGTVDAWLLEAQLGATLFEPRFVGSAAREGGEVRIPATADGVVSVGASVSRGFLAGEAGEMGLTLEADALGRVRSSSRGPRIDGAPLPTLVAPGGWMLVARSADIVPGLPGAPPTEAQLTRLSRGEDRLASAGTSLAAGVVAGAIALARAAPTRGHADVWPIDERVLLARTARAEAVYDAGLGAGVLDAAAYVSVPSSGALSERLDLGCTRSLTSPASSDVHVVLRSGGGGEGRVRTRVRGEPWSGTRWMHQGYVAVPLTVPARVLGTELVVEAELEGRIEHACSVVLGEPGAAPPQLAGGCAIAGGRHFSPGGPLVVLALLIGRRARSRRPARRGCATGAARRGRRAAPVVGSAP